MCICECDWRGCVYVYVYINLCLFVCLFDQVNRSVPTTIDSGLHGPQGPFSTLRAIGAFFYKNKIRIKIKRKSKEKRDRLG